MARGSERSGWVEYPLIAEHSKELNRNLTAGEVVKLNVHQHVMVLWKPAALLALLLLVIVSTLLDNELPSPLLLFALLAALVWLAWREAERRNNCFVATSERVLKIEGLIVRKVPVMRLGKVTDLRLERPLLGRMLNFGTITIESAGQDQSLHDIPYTRYPTQVYRRLNDAVTGGEMVRVENPRRGAAARAASLAGKHARRLAGRQVAHYPPPAGTTPSPRSPIQQGHDTDEIPTYRAPHLRPTRKRGKERS